MAEAGMSAAYLEATQGRRAAVLDHIRAVGMADASAISRAEMIAARTSQPIEQALNQLGALTDDDLVTAYAAVAACDVWEPSQVAVEAALNDLGVSEEFLRRARIIPLKRAGKVLTCAACDPLDDEAFAGLVFATGCDLRILVARPGDWQREFDRTHGHGQHPAAATDERRLEREIDLIKDRGADGAGARLVTAVFEAAIASGASDIHFEPTRNDLRIRLRVDGRMIDHQIAPGDLAGPAVSRVKVIANLNLGERRLPQDGRTTFIVQGKQVDVRVATSPTVFGESAVLRILDRSSVPLDLTALGLAGDIADVLRRASRAAHGMFLVSGPTGSGKTTTLYALLQTFAGSGKKVLSVEDPVEYHFEHVSQTQVAPQLGLSFATALRSFLRQDPDVILVGEIRDPETAAVAVQAAMTGHLVLASVHANTALGVVPRLQDMGVEPYQLAAGFRGAMAQRLVRRLCTRCTQPSPPSESDASFARGHGVTLPEQLGRTIGCAYCKGTGFKGRIPIGEGFLADDAFLRAVADGRDAAELEQIAAQAGLRAMLIDGADKVAKGLTTYEEVVAAVHG